MSPLEGNKQELTAEQLRAMTYAQISKLIINDLNGAQVSKSSLNVRYSKEQIIGFLENPKNNQKHLRQLSQYLYATSPNYKRLVWYFSGLLKFDYVVEPYDLDTEKVNIPAFKKQYQKTLKFLEVMNIPHEFNKILRHSFKDDVFYGYEHMTDDSYFIQKLDPDYCQIKSIEDGVYNFAFDFSVFDTDKNLLRVFSQEFTNKYNLYLTDKVNLRWQELDSKKTICIKINEEIEYPLPPFSVVFEAVFDIDDNKRMKRIKTKMDNYMILTQQIPVDEKSGESNKFLIDLDTAIDFHNKASQSLPDEVGLITSPMKIEAIKLEKRNTETDHVAQSERDYYNAAGVSQALFNGDNSVVGIGKSIITDEQIVFGVLRQIERWVNRKLKQVNKAYKFKTKFLDTTQFNYKDVQEFYLKSAQFGAPVKMELVASLGLSPSSLTNKLFLENEVLGLTSKFEPLTSSHTQSGKDGAGAPTKKDDDLSEKGVITRDGGTNERE